MNTAGKEKKPSTIDDLFQKGLKYLLKAIKKESNKGKKLSRFFIANWWLEDDVEHEKKEPPRYDYYYLCDYIGYCYQYIKKDFEKAEQCYQEAMKSSDSVGIDAKCELAELYYFYLHKEQQAFQLFCELLEHKESENYKHCLFYVGECYFNGWGVGKNRLKAKKYYKEAAREGSMAAEEKLALWKIYWI